jgi:hypothetical protein
MRLEELGQMSRIAIFAERGRDPNSLSAGQRIFFWVFLGYEGGRVFRGEKP